MFTIAVTKSYSTRTTSNGELLNILAGHHTTPFGCEWLVKALQKYRRMSSKNIFTIPSSTLELFNVLRNPGSNGSNIPVYWLNLIKLCSERHYGSDIPHNIIDLFDLLKTQAIGNIAGCVGLINVTKQKCWWNASLQLIARCKNYVLKIHSAYAQKPQEKVLQQLCYVIRALGDEPNRNAAVLTYSAAKLFETLIPVFAEYDRKEFLLRDNSQSYNYHDSLDFIMPLFLFLHKEYQIKYDDFWVYNYEVMVSNIICINILLIYIYT